MPEAITRECSVFGCGERLPCPKHSRHRDRSSRPQHEALYNLRVWRDRISPAHLRKYPRCGDRPPGAPQTNDSRCRTDGRLVPAMHTDHIVPHRGNRRLFFDPKNRQSLCDSCHGEKSARERRSQATSATRSDERGEVTESGQRGEGGT